jgi:uncharacterized OB-fold protein
LSVAERRPDRARGPVHDEFWAWCAKGELRLQRCAACGRYSWPPVQACEHCGGEHLEWAAMSGRGRVASWCTFERGYYEGVLPIPWNVILVELEEGPLFLSNPKGFTWAEISPDMPVRLSFVDCEDSAGAFHLPVFEKA